MFNSHFVWESVPELVLHWMAVKFPPFPSYNTTKLKIHKCSGNPRERGT